MSETFDFVEADPGAGGAKLAGDTFAQGGNTVFLSAAYLVVGPPGGPYERVESATPFPVVEAALNLAVGETADTAATDDTGDFSLLAFVKRLLSRLTTLMGQLPAALTGSGNLKVSLAESTASQAVTGTFFQATQPVSIAATVAVSGTFFQATQPVSAASLPLPTGAAAESGGNLAAAASSLAILDDWDESDRAKVNLIVGQAGVQGGAGASTALTQRIAIATDANAVDTELPAAAALSDTISNPTTPTIGSGGLLWNSVDSTWERDQCNADGTLLASAARTTDTVAVGPTNRSWRGVILWLNISSIGAGTTLTLYFVGRDPVSGSYSALCSQAATMSAIYCLVVYPGASGTTVTLGSVVGMPCPRNWRITVTHSNANSCTYSVGYQLIR